jgi:type IV pilus assembly protein PilF
MRRLETNFQCHRATGVRLVALLFAGAVLTGCASTGVQDDAAGDLGAPKESPADLYVQLAVEYLKDGQIETALARIKKGLDADNKNAQAHNVIALIYQRLGQEKLAEKHFREAARLAPKDPYVLNAWGGFLCDRGDFAEAQREFDKALENPLYATPWVALTNAGICAKRAGDRGRAEEKFRRSLSINAAFGPTLLQMAQLDYERDNYKSARTYLERFFKASRPTPQSLLLAVRVERKIGSRKRASAYEKMLRKSFPDAPEALML